MADLTNVEDTNMAALKQTMIERHCEWLNRHTAEWARENDRLSDGETQVEEHRYASSDFNPLTNEYGYRKLLATTLVGASCLIVHCEISDGDEGGPTILTGFHDEETRGWYRHKLIGDVAWTGWEKDSADWEYSHTEHVGWKLNDMMIEFDTQRTHTLRDGVLINCPDAADSSAPGDGDLVGGS